jgi:hypothetical protein
MREVAEDYADDDDGFLLLAVQEASSQISKQSPASIVSILQEDTWFLEQEIVGSDDDFLYCNNLFECFEAVLFNYLYNALWIAFGIYEEELKQGLLFEESLQPKA